MFLKCFGDTNSSQRRRRYLTVIEELCRHFSLADIRKSTKNFDESRLTERKGFGTKVYKGYLQHEDASEYAVTVKRLNVKDSERLNQFKNEIELLCQLRHPNIISLIGFCNHKNEHIIVYEYMSNGSLYQCLQAGKLSWKKRLEICIGVARVLHYLHAGAKRTIIHRDIRPDNILLDDHMEPKLTRFDISLQGARFMSKPKPIQVDIIKGTIGYIPMECEKDLTVTDKSDVYSFGIVLLEVVWGRRASDIMMERSTGYLENPVEEDIDQNIKGKIAPECWQVFIDIIIRCTKDEPDERPTMGEVEVELEHALSLQEQADITNTNSNYTLFSTTIIRNRSSVDEQNWAVDSDTNQSIESVEGG